VGLVPKRGCLLTLAYYAFPRRYEFGERRWNDIDRENLRTRRKTCSSATLSTTNPTWIDPDANPGLRSETPATNDLSHGTTQVKVLQIEYTATGLNWLYLTVSVLRFSHPIFYLHSLSFISEERQNSLFITRSLSDITREV
jgi:hypothetical protein